MSLSIRNQLPGTVTAVTTGEAMATVTVASTEVRTSPRRSPGGGARLGLAEGSAVRASSSPRGRPRHGSVDGLSIRNRLRGNVREITTGGAMASVRIARKAGS
ncbi:TOBE domain-containing protein [Streptomyces sp. F001]|uniref:TOBE domain-containing protein n=1 Tax=Streptomyces sp. F001 TaxID=1510026 RepID=UPI0026B667DF